MVKARCIYRRIVTSNGYLGSEQRASFGVMDRRMVLYPLVFVFCWGPGLFGADSDWFLLTTDAVSEGSACVCLSCCFLSGDSGVSASGGSRGVPGQSRGGALHPAGESRETRHSHFELVYLFVGVYLFLRLSNSLWLNLCVGLILCSLCNHVSHQASCLSLLGCFTGLLLPSGFCDSSDISGSSLSLTRLSQVVSRVFDTSVSCVLRR